MNNIPPFHTVRIFAFCQVILRYGETYDVAIDEPKFSERISYSVTNGDLILYSKLGNVNYLLDRQAFPKVVITYNQLKGIIITGMADVSCENIIQENELGLILNGNGSLNLEVDAYMVDCTIVKAGRINIKGDVAISRVTLFKNGEYDGSQFNAGEVSIHMHNNGHAKIRAENEINALIKGTSKLFYQGKPIFSDLDVDGNCLIKSVLE